MVCGCDDDEEFGGFVLFSVGAVNIQLEDVDVLRTSTLNIFGRLVFSLW